MQVVLSEKGEGEETCDNAKGRWVNPTIFMNEGVMLLKSGKDQGKRKKGKGSYVLCDFYYINIIIEIALVWGFMYKSNITKV